MDGHRSHVSIFLLKKVITKRRIIWHAIHFSTVGVKWKVVKYVNCPTLWMDTDLTFYLPAEKVITKRRIILEHAIP